MSSRLGLFEVGLVCIRIVSVDKDPRRQDVPLTVMGYGLE